MRALWRLVACCLAQSMLSCQLSGSESWVRNVLLWQRADTASSGSASLPESELVRDL